jgi:hypothetical protein
VVIQLTPKRAKFWIFENDGYVKVKVPLGCDVTWDRFMRHDEGWTHRCITYVYERGGKTVTESVAEFAQDCDGRLDQYWRASFDLIEYYRNGGPSTPKGLSGLRLDASCPRWRTEDHDRRDHEAEKAGY